MQAVILAGGLGTRISEESHLRPKPMIEIGNRPIIWHIMKIYSAHGVTDFVICCGYRGYMIKEYFANYFLHFSDVTIDAQSGEIKYHQSTAEPWRITLVDTGELTMTGGRLKHVEPYLDDDFCMTYGDGVADIDITAEIAFHQSHGLEATVAAVTPPGRYGALVLDDQKSVLDFAEKPLGSEGRVNGGFFVLRKSVVGRIADSQTQFEAEPLESMAADRQMRAFVHEGFWHAMDTLRDQRYLQGLCDTGKAPWVTW